MAWIAHPSYGLTISTLREIVDDIVRRSGFIADSIVAIECNLIRAVAICVRSSHANATLYCRQAGNVDLTIRVGPTKQLVIRIYINANSCRTVFKYGNRCAGLAADYGCIRLNAIHCINRIICKLSSEAGHILIYLRDIKSLSLLAAVGALRYLNIYATAFCC